MPLHSPADDGARRMGGPCLSHLSFKLLDGAVHLTAFYRSHDYRYKVPGNLLGLARLQDCVAREVGGSAGSLVVHSSYAYLNDLLATGLFGETGSVLSELKKADGRRQPTRPIEIGSSNRTTRRCADSIPTSAERTAWAGRRPP